MVPTVLSLTHSWQSPQMQLVEDAKPCVFRSATDAPSLSQTPEHYLQLYPHSRSVSNEFSSSKRELKRLHHDLEDKMKSFLRPFEDTAGDLAPSLSY